MKRLLMFFLLLGMLQGWLITTAHASDITLSSMVRSVQVALRNTQKFIKDNNLPTLCAVSLNLKTVSKSVGKGSLTLYIVSVGGTSSSTFSSSVTLKLVPPPSTAPSDVSPVKEITKGLQDSLLAAARAIRVARKGQPKLDAKSIDITFAFVLKAEGNGGLNIFFPPFGANLNRVVSSSEVQTITVSFK